MPKAVGIDLGTTNSVVAVLEAGQATVIPSAEGPRTTPSVVAFSKDGGILVGEVAKRQAITNPDRTVRSVTRLLGTAWTIDIDGRAYGAEDVSARILEKLQRDAEAYLGDRVTQAVVTVPSHFGQAQRAATKKAGLIAGLEVIRLVNAPSAAAIGYARTGPFLSKDNDGMTLVFDLGGGAFGVSILEIGERVFEVKATSGSTRLGGDDWDQRVVDWLVESFESDHGVDLSKNYMALQYLKEAAENAKMELSAVSEAVVRLPFVPATDSGLLEYTLTRAKFQQLTGDLVAECMGLADQVMKDAACAGSDVGHVVLVGGSTRMPAIRELVGALTGNEPDRGVNPDEVAALGAAVQAGMLKGEVTDALLLDVVPLSLGIETKGGVTTLLIGRNTTFLTKKSLVVSADQLQSAEIHVLQGDFERASANESIGRVKVNDLGSPRGGSGDVEVTFLVDENGDLHATATRGAPPRADQPRPPPTQQGAVVVDRPYLRVTRESILYGQDLVRLDQIDGVAYLSVKHSVNGIPVRMERVFRVTSRGKMVDIVGLNGWVKRDARKADETTWRALVGLSNQLIEPRLVDHALNRVRAGQLLQIGNVTVQSSGISRAGRGGKVTHLSWTGFGGVALANGQVVIRARGKVKAFATMQSIVMNAVILPPVLHSASTLFGP